jgi:exoribonuclease II
MASEQPEPTETSRWAVIKMINTKRLRMASKDVKPQEPSRWAVKKKTRNTKILERSVKKWNHEKYLNERKKKKKNKSLGLETEESEPREMSRLAVMNENQVRNRL